MRLTLVVKQKLDALVPVLRMLPDGQHVDIEGDGSLRFQCWDQVAVRALRQCFPGVVWTKRYDAACEWWSYSATWNDISLFIYACREAPPTCKAIEEEYEAEEQVPTAFETRTVKKTRVRWDCGNGDTKAAAKATVSA